MASEEFEYLPLEALRLGVYVDLDVGWMAHPFASSRFKISSAQQIDALRKLGVTRVRTVPALSDAAAPDESAASPQDVASPESEKARQLVAQLQRESIQKNHLARQQAAQLACERRFNDATRTYRDMVEQVQVQPAGAAARCAALVDGWVAELSGSGEQAIRLLTEAAGDMASLHPVNVAVLSVLLGRAMGLPAQELSELGIAAMVHDVGDLGVPARLRRYDESFSTLEFNVYQEHVAHGVVFARAMGLPQGAVQAIAQHHENVDGSGFPLRVRGSAMSRAACILALTNRYDSLCNPARPQSAMTPHEALAQLYAQQKARYDTSTLSAFIRMMGVYPPGSVVQLADERIALVISVNSSRPLRPKVLVYEPGKQRSLGLVVDLEQLPQLGIRRSLKPASLPAEILDFLALKPRNSYFFEAIEAPRAEQEEMA